MQNQKILVVDDEQNIRQSLKLTLENEGYSVHVFQDVHKAYESIVCDCYDLAIIDIRIGELTGLSLYQKMLSNGLMVPTIFMSGHASLEEAALTVKLGAFDFIEKPIAAEKIIISVKRALEYGSLKVRIRHIERFEESEFVGESEVVRNILREAEKVAVTDTTVLITGESGTGKELIAKHIHKKSQRCNFEFVTVNCSAIPENLIESALFGHTKGAFTGAVAAKKGYFEIANGGTLFLDEIGDMGLSAQAKVLRAIQNQEIQRVGADSIIKVNVRIITATHKNLTEEVKRGTFRDDLFYRISVVPIQTVPLRDHIEDIPLLTALFVRKTCQKNGFKDKKIGPEVFEVFKKYQWPGNVRELQNISERLVIMSGESITLNDLPDYVFSSKSSKGISKLSPAVVVTLEEFKNAAERQFIVSVLKKNDGNISKTAEALGIERTYLHKKISQHEIQKREYF